MFKIFVLTIIVTFQFARPLPLHDSNTTSMSIEGNMWQYSGKFEGDILLPTLRNGARNRRYRWAKGVVCYKISGSFSAAELQVIKTSLQNGFTGTCVQIKDCSSCCNGDYVDVTNNQDGCFSQVGRRGRRQVLNLGKGCVSRHNVIHEFNHAVGFVHEQNRPNRDGHITIVEENVADGKLRNFEKLPVSAIDGFNQPYDYCSIMHYDEYAFSKNGQRTIIPKRQPNCKMGFATDLSEIDKKKINAMYKC